MSRVSQAVHEMYTHDTLRELTEIMDAALQTANVTIADFCLHHVHPRYVRLMASIGEQPDSKYKDFL